MRACACVCFGGANFCRPPPPPWRRCPFFSPWPGSRAEPARLRALALAVLRPADAADAAVPYRRLGLSRRRLSRLSPPPPCQRPRTVRCCGCRRACVLGGAGVGGAVSGGPVLLLAAVSEFRRGELTGSQPVCRVIRGEASAHAAFCCLCSRQPAQSPGPDPDSRSQVRVRVRVRNLLDASGFEFLVSDLFQVVAAASHGTFNP